MRCSARQQRELFEAALAGVGQCGIITRALVDLVPAPPFVRVLRLSYTDNAAFFRDFRALINRGELNDVFNLAIPNGNGGFMYGLNAVKYFDPASPPDNGQLLRGLSVSPSAARVIRQYGEEWSEFVRLKRRFDPDGILTPRARHFFRYMGHAAMGPAPLRPLAGACRRPRPHGIWRA